jgi:aspartyl-tRNA(Asn)/glutamyl-tRNA(Gln) amidotransferase subunit A
MCFGSVGTDTGGSIRIPSTACGTVGLKPTYGELPLDGIVPLSRTLDHVGPMARTVADTALMFEAMHSGITPDRGHAGGTFTFGVPEAYFCERLHSDVRDALERVRRTLTAAGHTVRPVAIEHAAWTADVYLHIVLADAAWYHGPMLEAYADRYCPAVRIRLEMGRYVLGEDYVRAMRLRDLLAHNVTDALRGCDALLLPALPIAAPPLGAANVEVAGAPMPVRAAMLRLTQLFNVTGHPAIALPAGHDAQGFPLGMQLVGEHGRTSRLLALAAAAEPYMTTGPGSVGGGTG